MFDLIAPSVAFVESDGGVASGLLIDGGYIATNFHVVWPASAVRVVFPDGTELEEVPVVGWDPLADLAVLGPVDVSAQPLRLVDGESTPVGSELFLIGYQDEVDRLYPQPTINRSVLSNRREWERASITYLQTDARVAGGQSGGALVNSRGEVIGLTTSSFGEAQNGLSASSADVAPILEKLTRGEFASELGDRRLPTGDGSYEFEIELRHLWDTREFVFEAEEGTTIEIEIEGNGDGKFSVYDSFGLVLDVDGGYTGVESAEVELTSSGIHFLHVEMASGGEASTFTVTSSARLKPLDDPDDGRTIAVGDSIAASLDHFGDWDWYSIGLQEGDTVRVSTDSLNVDTLLYVGASESEFQEFVSDDDSRVGLSGLDSEIVYRAPHTGEYFVAVTEAVENASGGYYLSVEAVPENTPLTANSTSYQDSMSAEAEKMAGNFYDCIASDENVRQSFLSHISEFMEQEGSTKDEARAIAQFLVASREFFVQAVGPAIEAGDTSWFSDFQSDHCQGAMATTQASTLTSQAMANWLLMGDAERTSSGSVMLTPGKSWQVGALFYLQPMTSTNLRVEFSFEITGEGARADGIVLVAAGNLPNDDRASRSAAGGRLGNDLFTQAIGVEFDTWRNVWDTSDNHVGLSLMGDVTGYDHPQALAATELDLDFRNSGVYEAEVVLDADQIEVYLSNSQEGIQRELVLSATIPSTVPMKDYLEEYYIGLVAATGITTDRHIIHEVRLEVDGVDVSQITPALREYADRYSGGPGAIYVGDINQLVGPAPTMEQGDFEGHVPLGSLERHLWIYESPFYGELLEKARLTDPTPMTYDGPAITIQHVCINRALLPCRLMETYFAPNLLERTNGKLKFIFSSFPELGVAGPDTLRLVTDGTLDSATIYAGYVGGDIPHIDIQNLWGVYSSREQEFEASQAIIKDIEGLVLTETGGVIMNHNWYAGNDQFFFCGDKLESLEDFRGRRIRSHSTPLSDWISGMGGEPQFFAFAEVYTALERGILDCGVTGADAGFGQRWYEVTDYMIGPLLSLPFHSNVVSGAVWESIPADLQQILLEEAAEAELEALRLAAIQNEMGLIRNTTERGAGENAMEFVLFSEEMNFRSLNTAVMGHVVPAWVKRVGDASDPIIADTFNRKLGPIVGLRIEAGGAVVRVPITQGPDAGDRPMAGDFPVIVLQGQDVLGGERVGMASIVGQKPVVLNFWAAECLPCQGELPVFQNFYDAYRDEILVLAVDLGQFTGQGTPEQGRQLLAELGVSIPAGYTEYTEVLPRYEVLSIPTTVFVKTDGTIHHKWNGALNEEVLMEKAEEMLDD